MSSWRAGGRSQSKRHHYLPESYLKAWANDGDQVAVRRRDQRRHFLSSIRDVAVESHLYSISTESGLDDVVEVELSKFETPLRDHLKRLRDERTPRKGSADRAEIAQLLALQLVRTPEHFDHWLFPLKAANFTLERPISRDGMRRFLRDEYLGKDPHESELEGALVFANHSLSQRDPTKQEILESLFRTALEELAPRMADMAWSVEHCPRAVLATTDRPVAVWRRDPRSIHRMGTGLASADEVRFPLGPHDLLVLRPKFPEQRVVVEPSRVTVVNRHLAAGCHQLVVGCATAARDLDDLQLRRVRPALRFGTGPLFESDEAGRSVPTGRQVLHIYASYGDEVEV